LRTAECGIVAADAKEVNNTGGSFLTRFHLISARQASFSTVYDSSCLPLFAIDTPLIRSRRTQIVEWEDYTNSHPYPSKANQNTFK
jgi:hypothetical protein